MDEEFSTVKKDSNSDSESDYGDESPNNLADTGTSIGKKA